MSLSVDVFVTREDGAVLYLDVPPGCSDLAGHESTRVGLWGSEAARSLGARFLPQLATSDLRVTPDQIQDFLDECATLGSNISLLASSTGQAEDYIAARLDNIISAANRAAQVGGGVVIW
ncbi:hypothetical protein ACIRVF_39310 [Kitasatospora sp. NPDC101157]|uniref:hypothetical protein n=1 Tax=Kitasatospora sp. NPDC101157 TaxID=3364098 RepID=UPI0037F9EE2C